MLFLKAQILQLKYRYTQIFDTDYYLAEGGFQV